MAEQFSILAPATVGHLGPGFGVLGLAIGLDAELSVTLEVEEEGVRIQRPDDAGGSGRLDNRHDAILRGLTARAAARGLTLPAAIELELTTAFPHGVGLGSTAAEFALGIAAADEIGARIAKGRAAKAAAADGEGADDRLELLVHLGGDPAHAAAVFAGGLAAAVPRMHPLAIDAGRAPIDSPAQRLHLLRLPLDESGWFCAVVVPEHRHGAADVHRVLPATVPNMVLQRTVGRFAGLVAALATGDEGLLRDSILDEVHVPQRTHLTAGMREALHAADEAGAAGATIAGHGPAILALTRSDEAARTVASAMDDAFSRVGVDAGTYICQPQHQGLRVVDGSEVAEESE